MHVSDSTWFLLFALLAACADKGPSDTEDGATGSASTSAASVTGTGDASSTGGTAAPVEDCAFLVGKTFLSDLELECGLGPNGPVLCHWTISFTADTFTHQYSDIGESGPYTCADGVISASDGFRMPVQATITGATGELVWNDVVYHP